MASSLRPADSTLVAALLNRSARFTTAWMESVIRHLPEVQQLAQLEPQPGVACNAQALNQWLRERERLVCKEVEGHWLMQPALEAVPAVEALG